MDYTNFTLAIPNGPIQFDPSSLYAALQTVPDHPRPQRVGLDRPEATEVWSATWWHCASR